MRALFSISGRNAVRELSGPWWRAFSASDRATSSDAVEAAIDRARRELQLQPDDALYLRDLLEIPQPDATRGVL